MAARFVFLEYLRGSEHSQTSFEEPAHSAIQSGPSGLTGSSGKDSQGESLEKLHECLEQCLKQLPAKDRELILEYYQGEQRAKIERRSQLAARLALSMNALSIRACRIRDKLEVCVRACCAKK